MATRLALKSGMGNLEWRRATAECVPTKRAPAVLDAMARELAYKGAMTSCGIVSIKTVDDATSVLSF
jgi:hypothetical protein